MPLQAPTLDNRTFQQLVDEAKKRIPHYTDEWTDHNVSDPGVTLIELFAWLTETTLYRMNRMPKRHYIKFMDMLGMVLKAPVPAQVPVTFWLTTAAENSVHIPAGTEVASTQTEHQASIVFTTNETFVIQPPVLTTVLSRLRRDEKFTDPYSLRALRAGLDDSKAIGVFAPRPDIDDALYFGFESDLSHHVLRLDMDWVDASGAGPEPHLPPVIWEASTGENEQRWLPCEVEADTTRSFNASGHVQLHLPKLGRYRVKDQTLYWVRVRIKELTAAETNRGYRSYQASPKLTGLDISTRGGTTLASHARTIKGEFLGQSDGTPGQRFFLRMKPLLERRPDEYLEVQVEGEPPQVWQEVSDFADAQLDSRHYTLDSVTGELRFGPAVRQPNGDIKLYGAIPSRGASLIFRRYRYGGGDDGNVEAGVLNTLKTAIPYISDVRNRFAAAGGLDAETLEDAMVRAPKLLRHRDRAVTAVDYEDLALQTPEVRIGRVKCLQPLPSDTGQVAPGQVYLLIIPRVSEPVGYLSPAQLEPQDADVERLRTYLDARRLITTRLFINAPAYRWVAARVLVRAAPGMETAVADDIRTRLYRYLNPLAGGSNGEGWPFGRDLFVSDVYQCLQGTPHIHFVRAVELYVTTPGGGPEGDAVESVELVEHGVVVSGRHEVVFV